MFTIKKNGIVYFFGRVASLLASAIDFTPPSGMTSTNVQGAIEEVGKGEFIQLDTSRSGFTINDASAIKRNKCVMLEVTFSCSATVSSGEYIITIPTSRPTVPLTGVILNYANGSFVAPCSVTTLGDLRAWGSIPAGQYFTSLVYLLP